MSFLVLQELETAILVETLDSELIDPTQTLYLWLQTNVNLRPLNYGAVNDWGKSQSNFFRCEKDIVFGTVDGNYSVGGHL